MPEVCVSQNWNSADFLKGFLYTLSFHLSNWLRIPEGNLTPNHDFVLSSYFYIIEGVNLNIKLWYVCWCHDVSTVLPEAISCFIQ